MYYEKYGKDNNKCLVLLHSGGMTGFEWKPQINKFTKYFKLLVPDMLGHGHSLLPNDKKLSIGNIANAVIEMLYKENISKAHIAGSSMGGAVALWISINYPEVVDKLIIYRIGYKKNNATYAQTLAMANPDYWSQYGMHNWLSKIHFPQGGPDAWKDVIANVSKVLDPYNSDHNHSLEDLRNISASTLLIAGDRDPLVPVHTILEMADKISNSCIWIMPNATHITSSNTWRADIFSEEITRFLK